MSADVYAALLRAADGHCFELQQVLPATPRARLLWLPALGVAARHYLPLAHALAARGIAVYLHEWRGHGSSSLRASRTVDWGYRALLDHDLPASHGELQAADAAHGALPWIFGGHSLGGQLACLHAARNGVPARLWLVASGSPWWRSFTGIRGSLLPLAYRFLPWLAQRHGLLPGRRLGFGGNEARGLISDWARVGLTNRYAARGLDQDLERALRGLEGRAQAVVLQDDWMAPRGSLMALLDKLPELRHTIDVLTPQQLGVAADHFAWMRAPDAVADTLCRAVS